MPEKNKCVSGRNWDCKVLRKTKDYKISLCDTAEGYGTSRYLEQLELKINNEWVFIQNYTHLGGEKDFAKYSEALELAEKYNPKQGWFKNFGYGSLFDQFKETIQYKDWPKKIEKHDELQDFTILYKMHKHNNIWIFWGNHSHIGDVFQFFIWDPKIKNEIEKILVKKYKARICRDKICEYKVHIKSKKAHKEFHRWVLKNYPERKAN